MNQPTAQPFPRNVCLATSLILDFVNAFALRAFGSIAGFSFSCTPAALKRLGLRLIFAAVFCAGVASHAQTNYQQVWAFGGSGLPLIEGTDGEFYGIGGTNNALFSLNKDGTGYTTLCSSADSGFGLVQGADGTFFGMTAYGGLGFGTVFKLTPYNCAYQVLHTFSNSPNDGRYPDLLSQMLLDGGVLYGITSNGGSNNHGTVFKLHLDGSGFALVHSFAGGAALAEPQGGLIKATNGALYGMTDYGNTFAGAVFKLNPDGSGFQVLRQFNDTNGDPASPCLGLTQGSDGQIYGVTDSGGTNGSGALFTMKLDGSSYQLLHSFTEAHPQRVIDGSDGALYGVTAFGGSENAGTVFKLNKSGAGYTILHNFSRSGGDGWQPVQPLVQSRDGALWGSTISGGFSDINSPLGYGTIFRLFSGAPHITITQLQFTNGNILLNLLGGAAGQTYRLQARTNLKTGSWQTLGSATGAITGSLQFLDSGAATQRARFYRIMVQ